MNKNSDIKKAGLLYLIGNLFNKGIVFLTVPIFTRILSTYDYGIVTTYNSWASILNMVLGCALTMGVRAAFIDYEKDTDSFIASIVRFTLFVTLASTMLSIVVCTIFKVQRTLMLIVILCFLHGGFWAIIDDYLQYLMMKFKYKARTILMILPNLLASILSIATIILLLNVKLYLGRIVPTAIVYVLFGVIILLSTIKVNVSIKDQKKYIKYALDISMPLIVHGIALNLLSQSDRTMITWLADASQTGIYSLIYNFSMLATVITTSLEGIWVPFFIEKLKSRDLDEINKKVMWYINMMTIAMVCLILTGPEIVKLLSTRDYWEGIVIIPPIVFSNYLIFSYSLYVNIEHFHKKTKYITLYTVLAAVVNIVANYFFIPKYGYFAAAYTTLFSYVIALVLHARNSKKLEAKLFPLTSFVVPFTHIVTAVVAFYIFIDMGIIRWVMVLLYLVISIIRNKEILYTILKRK